MKMRLSHIMAWLLLCFLMLATVAILYATAQNIKSVQGLAIQSLQSTAMSLVLSAENVIRMENNDKYLAINEIISDRVVAYALIARSDGMVLFHTNPSLIGLHLPRDDFKDILKNGISMGRMITLQTGVPAYEFNHIIHNTHGVAEVLRLVLNTASADRIVSRARRVWWTVGGVLFFLWSISVLLWRFSVRYVKLQAENERDKQMALIGQMTAVLAHEIRNALGSIKGFAQLADENTSENDSRKQQLAAILTGTGRIESLVNNLLLFSRNEDYNMENVNAVELLKDALNMSSIQSWQGNIEFMAESPVYARADREKLLRVLINGIRNALESMGRRGVLNLFVGKENREVIIKIEDTGAGISKEAEAHLFLPYYTTKADGTGLGLPYSEKVLKGMGGSIQLSNKTVGKGAVLTIRTLAGKGQGNE